jgi:hypothetical protein
MGGSTANRKKDLAPSRGWGTSKRPSASMLTPLTVAPMKSDKLVDFSSLSRNDDLRVTSSRLNKGEPEF